MRHPLPKPSRLLGLLCVALAILGTVWTAAQDAAAPPAAQDASELPAEPLYFVARETWPEGREVGLVTLGPWEVMRIPAALGGLSPYERAMIAAKRLNDFIDDYGQTGTVRRIAIDGCEVVQGGNINIITADPASARDLGAPPAGLADRWCEAVRQAFTLGGHRVTGEPKEEAPPEGYRPLPAAGEGAPSPRTAPTQDAQTVGVPPPDTQAVPSPGAIGATPAAGDVTAATAEATVPLTDHEGHTIGRAVVRGPQESIARVRRVAQITQKQGRAELRALIPCSSETGRGRIERVPGVSVSAMASDTSREEER